MENGGRKGDIIAIWNGQAESILRIWIFQTVFWCLLYNSRSNFRTFPPFCAYNAAEGTKNCKKLIVPKGWDSG